MAKQKNSLRASFSKILGSSMWPIVAIISLFVNAALISTWVYMVKYRQVAVENYLINHRCLEPGYSRMLNSLSGSESKKFVAATLCFTDYQTGQPLDFNSLKPNSGSASTLPAHP